MGEVGFEPHQKTPRNTQILKWVTQNASHFVAILLQMRSQSWKEIGT